MLLIWLKLDRENLHRWFQREEIVLSDMVVDFRWLGGCRYGFDSNLWHKKHFFIKGFSNCLMLIIQYFERTCEIVSLIPPCFVWRCENNVMRWAKCNCFGSKIGFLEFSGRSENCILPPQRRIFYLSKNTPNLIFNWLN